jgi:hypothetical protein
MSVDKLVDSTQLDADLTSVANAIRTKGGTSASLAFPADFVSAIAAIPTGGGGGLTTIASGTFTGSNNTQDGGRQIIQIGNKMAKTDFIVKVQAKQGEEFTYNGNYQWVWLVAVAYKSIGYFDITSDGKKSLSNSSFYVVSNNSGTKTNVSPKQYVHTGGYIRNGSFSDVGFNTFQIWRNQSHGGSALTKFAIYLGHSNQLYPFPAVEYNYEVLYFGTDPTNDIVDLS